MGAAILDAVLKAYAVVHAPPETAPLGRVFSFALHKNPGIAFDIPVPLSLIIPITAIIVSIFGWSFGRKAWQAGKSSEALACLSIALGALGNMLDRLIHGFTTDYLIFFRLSAINISDVMIVMGMIMFLWYHGRNPSVRTQ